MEYGNEMFTKEGWYESDLTRLTGSSFSGASPKSLSNTSRSAVTEKGGVDVILHHKKKKKLTACPL